MKTEGQTYRLAARNLSLMRGRPDPPRELKFSAGRISWKPPADENGVTHYNVYADNEFNLVRQVPAKQLFIQDNLSARRVFIASFNSAMRAESRKVALYAAVGGSLLTNPGEPPTVLNFGALGDAQTVEDGAISASSASLVSASNDFLPADVGKLIIVVGAGAAGADLETTIAAYVSPSTVTLTASAQTTVSGAEVTWGTENRAAIQAAIDSNSALALPIGRYLVAGRLDIIDREGFRLIGSGDGSVLLATPSLSTNFFDILGCTDMEIAHFQIDGRYFRDISFSCMYGDGTAGNPSYGNIRIRHLLISNFKGLVFGIGANTGMTAHDVTYEANRFHNCGAGSFGANTIDTGSSGTKLRYKIIDNRFVYVDQPVTAPGNAIFAGHGTNEDFIISGNQITDCPTTGINVHNRPFVGEATFLSNFLVANNVIRRPGWNGISIFGGTGITVVGNQVYNPGQANDIDETRNGLFISHQITGASTEVAARDIAIQGNSFIDTQGTPTMQRGIYESSSATKEASGVVLPNVISGASVADVTLMETPAGNWSILYASAGKWSIGRNSQTAKFNVLGDGRFEHSGQPNIFTQISIESAGAAGSFFSGIGYNVRFNGTDWVSGFDGTSNGFGLILLDHGTGMLRIYTKASTGGAAQTHSPAALEAFLRATISNLGVINITGLTASRPVKTDVSKNLASGLIDLASGADTTGQLDAARVGTGAVNNTEFGYLDGLSSGIQAQLNAIVTDLNDNYYTKSETDTLLAGKSNTPHTHSLPNHNHGGVTAGTDATDLGGAATSGQDS